MFSINLLTLVRLGRASDANCNMDTEANRFIDGLYHLVYINLLLLLLRLPYCLSERWCRAS